MTSGVHNPADLAPVLIAIEVNRLLLAILQATTADTNVDLEIVDENVDAIRAVTDAQAILEETGGTLTTDGTEQDVYINNAPGGVYKPICVKINFTNQTVTEIVMIRTYSRTVDGGAWVEDDHQLVEAVPDEMLVNIGLLETRFGVRVTMEKTTGTNRDYVWEVFYKA